MLKKETIWREILNQCFSGGVLDFTQKALSKKLGVSLSTVSNALKLPRKAGAVRVSGRGFQIIDKEKFLVLWAANRNLEKEIIFETRVKASAPTIEGLMPPGVIFGAYSAYARQYKEQPADYDTVYIYTGQQKFPEIKKRFPPAKGTPNLLVLKSDSRLKEYGEVTPPVQTFVDLWNLPQWYAKDYLNELKQKLKI